MTYSGKQSIARDAAGNLGVVTGPQAGRLLGVQRGAGGTTATAHEAGAAVALVVCTGDCDGSGEVDVTEIIKMVNIALGAPLSDCMAGDASGDGMVEITEIIAAVNHALNGCH